jgi:hypothetical protein
MPELEGQARKLLDQPDGAFETVGFCSNAPTGPCGAHAAGAVGTSIPPSTSAGRCISSAGPYTAMTCAQKPCPSYEVHGYSRFY